MVVPERGIDIQFIKEFNQFIREKISQNWRFFIVVGGGAIARQYIEAARKVVGKITDWDLDFLGIHSTHLNAHFVRTIFKDVAHPRVILNYERKIKNLDKPLVVAAGWKPGCSTDYDAMLLVRDYGAKVLINMSNIEWVYDKDPKKFRQAMPIDIISWEKYEAMFGQEWSPGTNVPFDPVATKLAKQLNCQVYVIGKDLFNLEKILQGGKFKGTLISS